MCWGAEPWVGILRVPDRLGTKGDHRGALETRAGPGPPRISSGSGPKATGAPLLPPPHNHASDSALTSVPGPPGTSPQGSLQVQSRRLCTPSSSAEENKDSPSSLFLKALQV